MTDWTLIAGGRCAKQPWRVGIAGFAPEDQQVFLLSDTDWSDLQQQLPLEPLAIYGSGNGLLFERITDAQSFDGDGLLLIAHARQEQLVLQPAAQLQRYLLLRTAEQRAILADETLFAKLFIPAEVPRFDERLVYLDSQLLIDPACPDRQEWAAVREPGDQDYSRLYHRSADFWIQRLTAAIAATAAVVRGIEPLLSVIIPTYNYGRYLEQCVQSVLDQGVDDLEILVLDNASTDDTPKVMEVFATEPRVRYMRNRYNYGPGYNWRNGLRIAQGRYFTFLSADDYFNPGHLSRLLLALERHPHVAVGYTGIRWVDGQGQALSQPRHPGYRGADYVGGRNEVADLLIHDNYMAPSAVIYRREAFCQTWNPGRTYGAGDWEMAVQMAERYPDFAYADTPGVSYRWHGAQESSQFYASSEPLVGHLAIVEGVFERNAGHCLKGREREVAAHIERRLSLYPQERDTELGERARQLCERLETQALQGEEVLFSIILTTYNRPDLLKDALASVGNQSLRDFEVILINDNGEPVEYLLAEYDFPITYLRQGRNRGLSAARNAGLKLATGRYVVYLDDDDIYLPDHLAVLAEAFERHPRSVVYTGVEYVNERLEDGRRIELGRSQPFKHETFDRDRLFAQNYIPVNTWAHPREMLAEVGEFDTGLAAFEDWDMLLRLATRYPFVHVPAVTSEVHTREQSTSSDHMLGRERKNFPALYQMLYQRYSGSDSGELRRARRQMLQRLGVAPEEPAGASLQRWLAARLPTPVQSRLIAERLQEHAGGPQIGVIVLDSEGQEQKLQATLASLAGERCLYSSVQIMVLTANSQALTTAATDSLRFIQWDAHRAIAEQLNQVIRAGDFDWFMLVDAGDEFTASGLLIAALDLLGAPGCRAVYGDEVIRQGEGADGVVLRPDLNLDLLLSLPAGMSRHWLFNHQAWLEGEGFQAAAGTAFELDYILRLIESQGLEGLGHISEPLLMCDAPTLRDCPDEQAVLQRHLSARGFQNARVASRRPGCYDLDYDAPDNALVSILILLKDNLGKVQRCMDTVLEKTAYLHYEVLLLDQGNDDPALLEWLAGVEQLGTERIRVLRFPADASATQVRNQAAELARGEFLLWLDAGIAVFEADWLQQLLNHASRPEAGAVGAKLLAGDRSIHQAGLVLGLGGPVGRVFAGLPLDAPGYMQRLQVDQNYTALGGQCLMMRKQLFLETGGFDESPELARWADVDLCLRLRSAGYLNVWTPRVQLLINEERQPQATAQEEEAMYARWLPLLARDPAYNPNFSLVQPGGFKLADPALAWRPLSSWKPLPTVLAHPADQFGCGHYRIMQPFAALQQAGLIDGALSMGLMHVADLERYEPDSIVLQRQIGEERLEAMRRMQAFSRAFKVYELDDYLPNLPLKNIHREKMPKDIIKSLRRGLGYVDRFVVSTAPLAEAFAGLHADIRVIENRLPATWWQGLQGRRRMSAKPRVGWAGGSSHTGDLEMIADVVKELAGEVEWVFFGMCPDRLRPYVHEFHAGVPITQYPALLASLDLDLALAPVEQNLFNECKSNLRLLEYGACGFPVICSDISCYQGDGLPVTRVKNRFRDWVDAIRMHLSDLDATARQGDELQALVRRDWMLEGNNLESWRRAWLPD